MKILALDQAAKTGWSIFDNTILVAYGIIDYSKINDVIERNSKLKKAIMKLIRKYKPEVFVLEDIQYQKNILTYKQLARLLGTIENYFFERKYAFEIVKPGEWRKTCHIKGRKRKEQKRNAQLWVKKYFNIHVSEDEADAICIGWHMVKKMGLDKTEK